MDKKFGNNMKNRLTGIRQRLRQFIAGVVVVSMSLSTLPEQMGFSLIAQAEGEGVDGWNEFTANIYVTEVDGRPVIRYETNDKVKTSPIYYQTFAFDVADAYVDTNNGSLVETGMGEVRLILDSSYFTQTSANIANGRVTSTWDMDYGLFIEKARAVNPEWAAKMQDSSQTAALKWDPVIAVWDASCDGWSARFREDGTIENNWGQMYTKSDVELLANLRAWADPNSIRGKYARGLIRSMSKEDAKALAELIGLEEDELEQIIDEGTESIESTSTEDERYLGKETHREPSVPPSGFGFDWDWPRFDTYNYSTSGQFNIGEAIPTSEDVTNGYHAERWAGNAKVDYVGAMHLYPFSGNIRYKAGEIEYAVQSGVEIDPVTGFQSPTYDTYTVPYYKTEPYAYEVSRSVTYWVIDWAQFWELTSITDENTVFPGGVHSFSPAIPDVSANVLSYGEEGVANLTEESETLPDPEGYGHVDWDGALKAPGYEAINISVAGGKEEAAAAFKAVAEGRVKPEDEILVHNDRIEIDGVTYMNDAQHEYKESKDHNRKGMTWSFSDIPDGAYKYEQETQEESGKIPYYIKNKAYYTTITAGYKGFIGKALGTTPAPAKGGGGDPSGYIYHGYEGNEPIIVHTPVISPVELGYTDATGYHQIHLPEHASSMPNSLKTQLVTAAYNDYADYQLLLDHTYTIKFIEKRHDEHVGYPEAYNTPTLYNKYTKRKYVCFPFTVQVNNKIYEPTPDNNEDVAYLSGNAPRKKGATPDVPGGFTPWIELYTDDDNHDDLGKNEDSVTFYIPPWATEGKSYRVYYMVVPENADKEDFDKYREEYELNRSAPLDPTSGDGNPHLYNYMATYSMECQLSGLIYDFRVVGINDKDRYAGLKVLANGDAVTNGYGNGAQDYPFAPTKEEKTPGNKNRNGGTSVRYALDGTVTNSWPNENILPLSSGSSRRYIEDGELIKGNEIAFTVRTIANLWDEEIDEMYIKVNFSYVPYAYDGGLPAGAEPTPVDVYGSGTMKDSTGQEIWSEFILADSPQDRSTFAETNKGDEKFRGSFYAAFDASLPRVLWQEDDLVFSTNTANKLLYELKKPTISTWPREVYETPGSYLYLPSECSALGLIKMSSDLRLLTGTLEQLEQNLDRAGEANLLPIVSKDEHGVYNAITTKESTSDPKYWEKFRMSMQEWFGTYWIPNKLYIVDKGFDLYGYIENKGQIDENDPAFKKDGYLIVNFDIYTRNNNEPHLKYYGPLTGGVDGAKNKPQWKMEGMRDYASVGESSMGLDVTIPVHQGDVAIIDTGRSREDFYTIGTNIVN